MASGKETIELAGFVQHVPPATPQQKDAARRAVTARAVDVDDARRLLTMLGLLEQPTTEDPDPDPVEPRPHRPVLDEHGVIRPCPRGHLYTAGNTQWIRSKQGRGNTWKYQCRACQRERRAEQRAAR